MDSFACTTHQLKRLNANLQQLAALLPWYADDASRHHQHEIRESAGAAGRMAVFWGGGWGRGWGDGQKIILSKQTSLLSLPTHPTLPCEFPCRFSKAVTQHANPLTSLLIISSSASAQGAALCESYCDIIATHCSPGQLYKKALAHYQEGSRQSVSL